jgi:enoyl-CoA hydratase
MAKLEDDLVLFEARGPVALIVLNRPEAANAQDSALLYALDDAFARFAGDDDLAVAILGGAGKHFSAGHDLRRAESDMETSQGRRGMWWDHPGRPGVEGLVALEQDQYLGLCRRWRAIPKPTIAMVQGACIAGGLMLAWSCDLIVAADDAYFSDPTVALGAPGHELFRHPWEMGARQAKEFLFLGQHVDAERALALGMVNRVVPRAEMEARTIELAEEIARQPRFALALAKQAVNGAEQAMGVRSGEDQAFALHQLAHAHWLAAEGFPVIRRAQP